MNLKDMPPEELVVLVESGKIPSVTCNSIVEYLKYVNC